jgi:hypothetical protein
MACFSHNNLKYDLQRRQVERKRSFRHAYATSRWLQPREPRLTAQRAGALVASVQAMPPDSYAVGRRSFLQIVRGRNGVDHELQTRAAPIGTE